MRSTDIYIHCMWFFGKHILCSVKANTCCKATAIVFHRLLEQEYPGLKTKHSEVEYVQAVYERVCRRRCGFFRISSLVLCVNKCKKYFLSIQNGKWIRRRAGVARQWYYLVNTSGMSVVNLHTVNYSLSCFYAGAWSISPLGRLPVNNRAGNNRQSFKLSLLDQIVFSVQTACMCLDKLQKVSTQVKILKCSTAIESLCLHFPYTATQIFEKRLF